MGTDRSCSVVLDRDHCLERLSGIRWAAVALTVDALPTVVPAAVARIDDALYLRASPNGVLARCMPGRVVSLLVCDASPLRPRWSVSVTSIAERVSDAVDLAACRAVPLTMWTDHDDFVRVPMTIVTGRELRDLRPFDATDR